MNLYGFVGNDGVDRWDFLGLECYFIIGSDQTNPTRKPDPAKGEQRGQMMGLESYDKMKKAAQDAGYIVIENALGNDLFKAMQSPTCDGIIYYNHGCLNGDMEYDTRENGMIKRHYVPLIDIIKPENFNPRRISPESGKFPVSVDIVCCHWDKVVSPDVQNKCCSGAPISVGAVPVPQIKSGDQKGQIETTITQWYLTKFFESEIPTEPLKSQTLTPQAPTPKP